MARGKTAEDRPSNRVSDRYFAVIRELRLRSISSDMKLGRVIAIFDRLLARDELAGDEHGYVDILLDLVERYEYQRSPTAGLYEPGSPTIAGLAETGYKLTV